MGSEWKLQLYVHISAPHFACQFRIYDPLLRIIGEALYAYYFVTHGVSPRVDAGTVGPV
jgi:hypothetical protein